MTRLSPAVTLAVFAICVAACSGSDEGVVEGGDRLAWMVDAKSQDSSSMNDASVQDVFKLSTASRQTCRFRWVPLPQMRRIGGSRRRAGCRTRPWIDPANMEASYVVQSQPPGATYGGTLFVDDGIIVDEDQPPSAA